MTYNLFSASYEAKTHNLFHIQAQAVSAVNADLVSASRKHSIDVAAHAA